MRLHASTFDYLSPTDSQKERLARLRTAAKVYADVLAVEIPAGPGRNDVLNRVREVAMWANVAALRKSNGAPRV